VFNIILILLCIFQILLVPEEYELKIQFLYCLKSCIKSEGLIEKNYYFHTKKFKPHLFIRK